jgi:Spy/CpxP family protein refolding chaperone
MKRRLMIATIAFTVVAHAQLKVAGGNWWKNQGTIDRLNLTTDQQKKLEDVFQQNRVRLIDQTAAVDREEVIMEQLMAADALDVAKLRSQIDKVAEARAQLEKTNANMLLGMRMVLTKDQWDGLKLRSGRRGATVEYFETPGRGAPIPKAIR